MKQTRHPKCDRPQWNKEIALIQKTCKDAYFFKKMYEDTIINKIIFSNNAYPFKQGLHRVTLIRFHMWWWGNG